MRELLKPLKTESLVEIFIRRFEELILSEKLSIGEKLLSERELAMQLGVSRSVVHEGLIELEARGLVKMKPRVGTFVSDYRRYGSLTLLNSLVDYSSGIPGPDILESMLKMRILIETETAGLAAINRTPEHLKEFKFIIDEERIGDRSDIELIVSLDFEFHLLTAIASGNLIYPLMLNSFKEVYTNLTREFFIDNSIIEVVFNQHEKLFRAIEKKESKSAVKIMNEIISHGESHLKKLLSVKKM
jgi:DNA-binding FadR family transcriptional regulator